MGPALARLAPETTYRVIALGPKLLRDPGVFLRFAVTLPGLRSQRIHGQMSPREKADSRSGTAESKPDTSS